MLKQKILLFMTVAFLSFSGCAEQEPCPICPEITLPYVAKQSWQPLEVYYERVRYDK